MNKRFQPAGIILLITTFLILLTGCMKPASDKSQRTQPASSSSTLQNKEQSSSAVPEIDENGSYTSKDDVAAYLVLYGKLPVNFITKKEARSLGWSGGSLESFAPGKCIGGDYFGNYEEHLPVVKGRTYRECDIDTLGKKSRGAKRIIYSDDGNIYYTDDHYESFTLLYGEDTP